MKRFLMTSVAYVLLASSAIAQQQQPMPSMQQMQDILKQSGLGNVTQQDVQRALQMGAATMEVHNCARTSVGQPAYDRFMGEVQTVGKQVQAYCDQRKPDQARELALSTLETKSNDPVAVALKNCYQDKKPQMEAALPADKARDFANYERWSENPELAAQEMQTTDICRYKTN